jgi:hypothetical protein
MPVEGHKHKRVWQYRFAPQPVGLLDRGWSRGDREWERGVIERLRRGEAAPRSLSTDEAVPSPYLAGAYASGGWEHAEAHAKDAIRTGAAFLNDEAIARRKPQRDERTKAYAEYLREQHVLWHAQEAERVARAERQRLADEAARAERRAELERAGRAREARERARAESDDEWDRIGREKFLERRWAEVRQIMRRQWRCGRCDARASISERAIDAAEAIYVYRLKCSCADRWWYHDDLLELTR